jgi:hypothetical protein
MKKTHVTHAISIRQPWAHLIASGWRPVELRSWPTKFRGTIAIHAGTSYSDMSDYVYAFLTNLHPDLLAHMESFDGNVEAGIGSDPVKRGKAVNPASQFHFGAIIGTVDIIDCLPVAEAFEVIETTQKANGEPSCRIHPCDWVKTDSGYVWLLQNAKIFKSPIPAKGKLQIFALTDELQAAIAKQA